jgi:hypothetical protein
MFGRARVVDHVVVVISACWFGPKFPQDVDELHFQVVCVIKDVDRLRSLFDLFVAVLDQLCNMGWAYKQETGVQLKKGVCPRKGSSKSGVSPGKTETGVRDPAPRLLPETLCRANVRWAIRKRPASKDPRFLCI